MGGLVMFRKIIEKLSKTQEEMDEILQRIVAQNEDMEELSEQLLGERLSDEIMSQVIEQEFTKVIEERIKEAFE
jgi:DNA-binding FrmR family transcriptional regulator